VSKTLKALYRDGVVIVPNYLSEVRFATIREECERRVAQTHIAVPMRTNLKPGTGHCRLLVNNPGPLPLSLYENIHGDEGVNHDVQKDIHRDTFHHTYEVGSICGTSSWMTAPSTTASAAIG
jgi:hypothetical protein